MLTLTIRFLAGRHYATAWDHHVNEGTIEWPPSPWRILRALVAASYRLDPQPSDEALTLLLTPLAEALPSYEVPPYAEGHTRHFMPLDNKGLPGDKSALIFNAFVAPGSGADAEDGELKVVWPEVALGDAEADLLRALCSQIGYLGRAESWVTVTPDTETGTEPARVNCVPADGLQDGHDSLRLMALARRAEHLAWHQSYLSSRRKKRPRAPETLLDVLRQDTGTIRGDGWSDVPGTRWAAYVMRRRGAARWQSDGRRAPARCALYRIAGTVLPSVTKSLQVGERMHQALVAWSDDGGGPHAAFAGSPTAPPGGAGHAAVCPLDVDQDGCLDHLLVYARDGLDGAATHALERGRKLRGVGPYELIVTLVGVWTDQDLDQMADRELPPALRRSRVWRSTTPFVLVRHPKLRKDGSPRLDARGRWADGPEAQLELELARRSLPTPARVLPADALEIGGRRLGWHRFQRSRRTGGGLRAGDKGYGFEIQFDEPVRGPILVGYGRFFGLGQFSAIDG